MDTKKVVVIFDSDGVLLDTTKLTNFVAPWLVDLKVKSPKWWNILRKVVILCYADRVCDGRLSDMPSGKLAIERIDEVADGKFVVTKRPFIFGAKKRLMKQLNYVYGEGVFEPQNVFSSFFSKNKAHVIRERILRPGMVGVMVDDNIENLANMPKEIIPVLVGFSACDDNVLVRPLPELSRLVKKLKAP